MRLLPGTVLAAALAAGCGSGRPAAEGDPAGDPGAARRESDVFVEDDGFSGPPAEVRAADPHLQVVSSPRGRARLFLYPETLARDADVYVRSRPLSDFADTSAIIDGVYDFQPDDVRLLRPAQLVLPLNGLPLWDAAQVELVTWPLDGQGWDAVPGAVTALGDDRASAWVRRLGTYGLRVVGGFAALPDGIPVEEPVVGECPKPGVARGSAVGRVVQDPALKDADGQPAKLYDRCGGKAVLIVSAAMW